MSFIKADPQSVCESKIRQLTKLKSTFDYLQTNEPINLISLKLWLVYVHYYKCTQISSESMNSFNLPLVSFNVASNLIQFFPPTLSISYLVCTVLFLKHSFTMPGRLCCHDG